MCEAPEGPTQQLTPDPFTHSQFDVGAPLTAGDEDLADDQPDAREGDSEGSVEGVDLHDYGLS